MTMFARSLLFILLCVGLGACTNRRPSQTPDAYENFNEDEYGRVQSSQGQGVESSGAYYGSQPSGPPSRTPAEPSVGGSGR